jgi:hypothetical protein
MDSTKIPVYGRPEDSACHRHGNQGPKWESWLRHACLVRGERRILYPNKDFAGREIRLCEVARVAPAAGNPRNGVPK